MIFRTNHKILKILVIIANLVNISRNTVDFYNYLDSPIYLGSQPYQNLGQLKNIEKTGAFMISGWIKSVESQQQSINVLRILNKVQKQKNSFNQLYPQCPFSQSFLKENPSYLENIQIKNNPNCQSQKKEQVQKLSLNDQISEVLDLEIVQDQESVQLQFDFPIQLDKQNQKVIFNSDKKNLALQKIGNNFWVFFAISFDYPNSKGKFYAKMFDEKNSELNSEFELNLPKFYLHKSFQIYFSENTQITSKDNFGLLYDVNLLQYKVNNLKLFSIYNYYKDILKKNNNLIELDFEDTKQTQPIVTSKSNDKTQYTIEGEFKINQRSINLGPQTIIKLGKIFSNQVEETLIKAPTFYFSFKVEKLSQQFGLLSSSYKNSIFSVVLQPQQENNFKIEINCKVNKSNFKYQSQKTFDINQHQNISISLIYSNRLQFYIWSDQNGFENSEEFLEFEGEPINWNFTLLDQNNKDSIELNRFLLLQTPLPFILDQELNNKCKLFEVPSFKDKDFCIQCSTDFVLRKDKICYQNCEKGEKNVEGVCIDCQDQECSEIIQPKFVIEQKEDLTFLISLDQLLESKNFSNFKKNIKVNIEEMQPEKDFKYVIRETNDINKLKLIIQTQKSLYNKNLTIFIDSKNLQKLVTNQKEVINNLETTFKVTQFKKIEKQQKTILKALVYILVVIFWTLTVYGVILFALQFKYNICDFSLKKLSYVYLNIQITALFIFTGIPLPPNLHYFVNELMQLTISYFGVFQFLVPEESNQPTEKFYNLEKKIVSSNFIENMTIVNCIHFILIFGYFICILCSIVNKFKHFTHQNRERLFLIRDSLEFSVLIIAFVIFCPTIFAYVILNMKNYNQQNPVSHFSYVVSLVYFVIFIVGLILFFILFIVKNGFINFSKIKNKLDYLFFGYTGSKLSNLYEILLIISNCLIGIVFTALFEKPVAQVSFLMLIQLFKLINIAMTKPHLEKWTKISDLFEKTLWSLVFLLIACLAMFDINKDSLNRFRIAQVIIGLICVQIILDFLANFFISLKYILNLKNNKQITLYSNNHKFQQVKQLKENNSLVESSQVKEEYLEQTQSIKSNSYTRHKKGYVVMKEDDDEEDEKIQKSSKIQSKRKIAVEELDELESGKGSHHDSYISKSNSFDRIESDKSKK